MPNLPTSLILVLLALAWLVVLVPMFARGREAVPETDDGVAGFRVLQRAGARMHSPRQESRRVSRREAADSDLDRDDDDALVGELVDEHRPDDDELDGDLDELDDDIDDRDDDRADHDDGLEGENPDRSRRVAVTGVDTDRVHNDRVDTDRPNADPDPDAGHQDDAADEWEREHRRVASSHSRPSARPSTQTSGDPSRTPAHRPGRGGFDPEHAAATAAYRFRRRRLVTLALVVIVVVLIAGATLISSGLWIGVVVTGLVLAGYLTYLNRTVRIERAIAERRTARMRRAQEIRPTAVREAGPVSPYHHHEQQAPAAGPTVPSALSHVPASSRRAGVVVDLDDDDPAFDDLEYYEPVVYRHAAGQ